MQSQQIILNNIERVRVNNNINSENESIVDIQNHLKLKFKEECEKWLLNFNDGEALSHLERYRKILENFGLEEDESRSLPDTYLETKKSEIIQMISSYLMNFYKFKIILNDESYKRFPPERRAQSDKYLEIFERLMQDLDSSISILFAMNGKIRASCRNFNVNVNIGLSRFQKLDEDAKPIQKLHHHIWSSLSNRDLKRKGADVYEPIFTRNENYYTFSYKKLCSIEDFIYKCIDRSTNYNQYLNATDVLGNLPYTIKQFPKFEDVCFPDLQRDRYVMSFRNGIYFVKCYDERQSIHHDTFVTYEELRNNNELLNQLHVKQQNSINYIDQDMILNSEFESWKDIKTPLFDKFLEHQWPTDDENCEDNEFIQLMVFCFMGRMLYYVNELDSWEKMPFFFGIAGTGKSSIVDIVSNFYQNEDVIMLNNNFERQFGLMNTENYLIMCGPEIKKDFSMEQATLQQMITGEKVRACVKHGAAYDISPWKTPLICAGNQIPGMEDNSNSLIRRLVIFNHQRAVTEDMKDDSLKRRILTNELALIIRKSNLCYQKMVNELGNRNIDTILNQYQAFRSSIDVAAQELDSFYKYLRLNDIDENVDGTIKYESGRTVKLNEVIFFYQKWTKERNIKNAKTSFTDNEIYSTLENISRIKKFKISFHNGIFNGFNYCVTNQFDLLSPSLNDNILNFSSGSDESGSDESDEPIRKRYRDYSDSDSDEEGRSERNKRQRF